MSDTYSAEDKLEKGFAPDEVVVAAAAAPDDSYIVNRYARYGRFGPLMQRLFASGVEARGVERVPESERETKNVWNKCVPPLLFGIACACTVSLNVGWLAS